MNVNIGKIDVAREDFESASVVSIQEYLYDILFEISSQERHKLLIILRNGPTNLTHLSNKSELNLPETRRHVTRLIEVDLIERNPDGRYSLTYLGSRILELVDEFYFFARYREYFLTHSVNNLPKEFRSRLRDLSNSVFHDNIMIFIHSIDQIIKNAEKEIFLLIDDFPLYQLSIILEAIEKGINIKILEPKNRETTLDPNILTPQENIAVERMMITPLVEQRFIDKVRIFLVMSEKDSVIAFPNIENNFDYKGFRSNDKKFLSWCRDLFQQLWNKSSHKINEFDKENVLESAISNYQNFIFHYDRRNF
jgi:predicted transcriptional regulator